MQWYNFHTHCHLDDGKMPLENYAIEAIRNNMAALGFSAHAPLPLENEWSLTKESFQAYLLEARQVKEKFKNQIPIYISLEMDYIPGLTKDFAQWVKEGDLDYTLGSIHLVKNPDGNGYWFIDGPEEGYLIGARDLFNMDFKKAVKAFYDQSIGMIKTQKPQIIGHLDKVKMYNREKWFSENDKWYRDLVYKLLDEIKTAGTIVEVNTRGKYSGKTDALFPSPWIIKACVERDIPLMLSADAHHPSQLCMLFDETTEILRNCGCSKTKTPFFEQIF